MTDGGASFADREAHMRYTGFLDGIYMHMAKLNGLGSAPKKCPKWESIVPRMGRWIMNGKGGYQHERYPFMAHYVNDHNMSMGIADLNAQIGMSGACNFFKEGSEYWSHQYGHRVNRTDKGAEPDGELPDGKEFGYTTTWLMNNWHPAPRGSRLVADIVAFWMLESAYNFIDQRAAELNATRNYAELEQYLKKESGEWRKRMVNSIKSGDIRKNWTLPMSEDMFPRPMYCGTPNGQCLSGIPFSATTWAPHSWNTHSKLREYIRNPVPLKDIQHQLGWQKVKQNPNRPNLEYKTGGPAWMDDKGSWQCDGAFYARKFEQFAKGKKGDKLNLDRLPQSQMDDLQRAFHADLIEKKLYLQLGVKVPLFGNGTVLVSKWGGSWYDDKMGRHNGSEQAIAYIATIDDKTIGVPSSGRYSTSWQGLKPGQKYKLSIVPYKIYPRSQIAFSTIVAF